MKKLLLSFFVLFITATAMSQATYYWVGGLSSGQWTTAASWNTALDGSGTARTTALKNAGDTLIFDGSNLGGATPVTGAALIDRVDTASIASLRLQNGANITFINSAGPRANMTGVWAKAGAVAVPASYTAGSNVVACTNTSSVYVGSVISTATSGHFNLSITRVTSVTPNVSFTTSLPALQTGSGTVSVTQPSTWTGSDVLNVGDWVVSGTNSNYEQIESKIDNTKFFVFGTINPQTAISAVTNGLRTVAPLTLTSPTNALSISANSSLTIDNPATSRPLIIMLAPGAKGTVEGTIDIDLTTNTFNTGRIVVAPTGGAQLTFKPGSMFKSGQLSFPFGVIANDDNNNIVFEAGSQAWYGLAAGTQANSIFGAMYPKAVVQFNKGSLFVHNGGADRFTGYTYREFPDVASNVDLTIFQPAIVGNITIAAGQTITQSAGNTIGIKGNIINNGTFAFGNATNGVSLNFIGDGTTTQALSGTGTITYNSPTTAGGSFNSITVGAAAKVAAPAITTYRTTNVFGTLDFGNRVMTNVGDAITGLNVRGSSLTGTALNMYATNKQNTLFVDNLTNFNPGMFISGNGIPANTQIVSASSNGNVVLMSNPATVAPGETITASANPSGATIITANGGGIPASYTVMGTSTYALASAPGANYRFEAATTTPFPALDTVNARNLTLAANVSSNIKRLNVNSTLDLGGNTFTVPVNDTVFVSSGNAIAGSNASKYVVLESNAGTGEKGILRIGNINAPTVFPIGTATSYLPVTITPAGAGEDYSINVFTGITTNALPNGPAMSAADKARVVDAVWTINNNFTPTGNATVQFAWPASLEGSSFTGYANNQVGIWQNTGTWMAGAGTGDNTANTVSNGFSSFGAFAVGEAGGSLPVKFGTLSVTPVSGNECRVIWKVFTEINVARYVIEASGNGQRFSEKGFVAASGREQYQFIDANAFAGLNFYRIKAIDTDGHVTYSNVVKVNLKQTTSVSIYPNPVANHTVQLAITHPANQQYNVQLCDLAGRIVYATLVQHNSGTGLYKLAIPANVIPGNYLVKLVAKDGLSTVTTIIVE